MKNKTWTDPFLRSIKSPEKQTEIYDADTKGLALRITPAGSKSFVYRYRFGNDVKRFTIGNFPALSLGMARKKAGELSVMITDGIDPLEERKRKKRAANIITVKELIKDFKKDYLPKKKPSTQKTYSSRINKIEKKFGRWNLDEVSRKEVKRFLKSIAHKHPTNANRVQAIFSKLYSYARKEGYTDKNPLKGLDKIGGKEKTRNPNYTNENIRELWNAFEEQEEPFSSLFKLLVITGQRLGETSRMKWKHIDQQKALWIIPEAETKGKKVHIVPIPEMAAAILEKLYPKTGDKDYVFASPKKYNKPLVHFHAATERIRKSTELSEFKIHDLRHVVITGMISLGVDFVHVGKTVAHKGLAKEHVITSRYAHYEYLDEKRKALNLWSQQLLKIVSGEAGSKIFKIGS